MLRLPRTKINKIQHKKLPYSLYEAKKDNIRIYFFHEEKTGRIIVTGGLSQILNSGEINFSIEKLFSIALKIDKIPTIKLENKEDYTQAIEHRYNWKNKVAYRQQIEEYGILDMSSQAQISNFPVTFNNCSQINIPYN